MLRKKYCSNCRWFQSASQGDEYQLEKCMAIVGYNSDYQCKKITIRAKLHPSDHNKHNDCGLYNWHWFGWRGY